MGWPSVNSATQKAFRGSRVKEELRGKLEITQGNM
jgi:hypothetical protein